MDLYIIILYSGRVDLELLKMEGVFFKKEIESGRALK